MECFSNAPPLTQLFYYLFVFRDTANTDAFVKGMERYGFEGVDAFDIVKTGKEVREELSKVDPEKAAGLWVIHCGILF